MSYKVSLEEAKTALAIETVKPFVELLQHGTMSVEYSVPKGVDTQQPHRQDELYIIASRHAAFD